MRTLLPFLALVLLAGCGSQSESTAPTSKSSAPSSAAKTGEMPSEHPTLAKPASAKLNESQVKVFLQKMGDTTGHGKASPEQVAEMTKQVMAIKAGSDIEGPIHVDHNGAHLDLLLKIARLDEKTWEVTVNGPNQGAVDVLGKALKESVK